MPVFYFRNDDVNTLDSELVEITRRLTEQGVPLTHAVEPANLAPETAAWLLAEKAKAPRLVEIMQHGYDHMLREKGEFGGRRPYQSQLDDLRRGRRILEERFGDAFFPCLNFPFGPYNAASMRAADAVGYRVISSHFNQRLSRRVMYAVGHALRRGRLAGKHVSWHLDFYPGTRLFCVDMAVSFIQRYLGVHPSRECVFHDLTALKARVRAFVPHTPVIGILLHHRFHYRPESMDLVSDLVQHLKTLPDAEFLNIGEIYARFCPTPGAGFRND